jgi:hypothetical protein
MQSPKDASMMLLLLIALFSLLPLPVLALVEIAEYYSKTHR